MPVAYHGVIFDVDGELVDSSHERAWRGTLRLLMETDWHDIQAWTTYAPQRFAPANYQEAVADKSRLRGARAVLDYFDLSDAERRGEEYPNTNTGRWPG